MSEIHEFSLEHRFNEITGSEDFDHYCESVNIHADGILQGKERDELSKKLGRLSFAERQLFALLTYKRNDGLSILTFSDNAEPQFEAQNFTELLNERFSISGATNTKQVTTMVASIIKSITEGIEQPRSIEDKLKILLRFRNEPQFNVPRTNLKEILTEVLESDFFRGFNTKPSLIYEDTGIIPKSNKTEVLFNDRQCLVMSTIIRLIIKNGYHVIENQSQFVSENISSLISDVTYPLEYINKQLGDRFTPAFQGIEKADKGLNGLKKFIGGLIQAERKFKNSNIEQ